MTDETPDGLLRRWFHSYVPIPEGGNPTSARLDGNGNMREWQGQIIAKEGDLFIVQLYSWWDGCATNQVLVEPRDMKCWQFFDTNEDMLIADGCIENRRGVTCGNPCTHVIRDWGGMGSIYRCWKCIKFYVGRVEELRDPPKNARKTTATVRKEIASELAQDIREARSTRGKGRANEHGAP